MDCGLFENITTFLERETETLLKIGTASMLFGVFMFLSRSNDIYMENFWKLIISRINKNWSKYIETAFRHMRGAFGYTKRMHLGLILTWSGAAILAGVVKTPYWSSILIEVAVGAGLFQTLRVFSGHRFGILSFSLTVAIGLLVAYGAYSLTECRLVYFPELLVGLSGGIIVFALLEMGFNSIIHDIKRGDIEARNNFIDLYAKILARMSKDGKNSNYEQEIKSKLDHFLKYVSTGTPLPSKAAYDLREIWDKASDDERAEFLKLVKNDVIKLGLD